MNIIRAQRTQDGLTCPQLVENSRLHAVVDFHWVSKGESVKWQNFLSHVKHFRHCVDLSRSSLQSEIPEEHTRTTSFSWYGFVFQKFHNKSLDQPLDVKCRRVNVAHLRYFGHFGHYLQKRSSNEHRPRTPPEPTVVVCWSRCLHRATTKAAARTVSFLSEAAFENDNNVQLNQVRLHDFIHRFFAAAGKFAIIAWWFAKLTIDTKFRHLKWQSVQGWISNCVKQTIKYSIVVDTSKIVSAAPNLFEGQGPVCQVAPCQTVLQQSVLRQTTLHHGCSCVVSNRSEERSVCICMGFDVRSYVWLDCLRERKAWEQCFTWHVSSGPRFVHRQAKNRFFPPCSGTIWRLFLDHICLQSSLQEFQHQCDIWGSFLVDYSKTVQLSH